MSCLAYKVIKDSESIYLNAKVSQLLLKCYFLLFEPNILLHDIVINKSNNLPSKQHENETSETYECRSPTRNVRQPKFEKSQSFSTLHFIESQFTPPYILFGKGVLLLSVFKNRVADKSKQIILCIWLRSLRQRKAFNIRRNWPFKHN